MIEPTEDVRLRNSRLANLYERGEIEGALAIAKGEIAESDRDSPVTQLLLARLELLSADAQAGCARAKQAVAGKRDLPKDLQGEAIVLAGYCAAKAGRPEGAGLAAELARDIGYARAFTLALLDSISNRTVPRVSLPSRISALDGMLAQLLSTTDDQQKHEFLTAVAARASSGLTVHLARDGALEPAVRIAAAEQAARSNSLAPAGLADAYRSAGASETDQRNSDDGLTRAALFITAERTQAQFAKTRAIRTFLDSARRNGLFLPAAQALTPIVEQMRPTQEIGWFSETAVEVLAAGGSYLKARQWIEFSAVASPSREPLSHWIALLDIADASLQPPERGNGLNWLESAADQSNFSDATMHRLATVLDALNYQVPIQLWNRASRTPQPKDGHLPETGILTELADAAKQGHVARAVFYAARTIGPGTAADAHILALGEAIRGLKRLGLEHEARRIGFESLFLLWPRTSGT